MDPAVAANGFASNPLAWGLVAALAAVGFLFRTLSAERAAFAAALERNQTQLVETLKADAKEQREILSQIVPLATRLTEGIEILERISLTKE